MSSKRTLFQPTVAVSTPSGSYSSSAAPAPIAPGSTGPAPIILSSATSNKGPSPIIASTTNGTASVTAGSRSMAQVSMTSLPPTPLPAVPTPVTAKPNGPSFAAQQPPPPIQPVPVSSLGGGRPPLPPPPHTPHGTTVEHHPLAAPTTAALGLQATPKCPPAVPMVVPPPSPSAGMAPPRSPPPVPLAPQQTNIHEQRNDVHSSGSKRQPSRGPAPIPMQVVAPLPLPIPQCGSKRKEREEPSDSDPLAARPVPPPLPPPLPQVDTQQFSSANEEGAPTRAAKGPAPIPPVQPVVAIPPPAPLPLPVAVPLPPPPQVIQPLAPAVPPPASHQEAVTTNNIISPIAVDLQDSDVIVPASIEEPPLGSDVLMVGASPSPAARNTTGDGSVLFVPSSIPTPQRPKVGDNYNGFQMPSQNPVGFNVGLSQLPPPPMPEPEEQDEDEADLEREAEYERRHEEDIAFTQQAGGPVCHNKAAAPGHVLMDSTKPVHPSGGGLGNNSATVIANGGVTSVRDQSLCSVSPMMSSAGQQHPVPPPSGFYGLPQAVHNYYRERGVKKPYDWQHEILSNPDVLQGKSLVYSLPTSGGKTLVAEILLLRCVAVQNKSAMFILPYVSIAEEKLAQLQKVADAVSAQVEPFYGMHGRYPVVQQKAIFVCTIEKANSLWNQLVEEGRCGDVGCVVVDEIHMLGEAKRGATLEMLLCKMKHFNTTTVAAGCDQLSSLATVGGADVGMISSSHRNNMLDPRVNNNLNKAPIQIIGMSATIPNLDKIAEWLEAICFEADFRPVPLKQYCVTNNGQVWENGTEVDRVIKCSSEFQCVLDLCWEVCQEHSVLVFCASRQQTVDMAKNIARGLAAKKAGKAIEEGRDPNVASATQQGRRSSVDDMLRHVATNNEPVLSESLPHGVAFHHAGLLAEERTLIENAFRSKVVTVLCCTSTLAAGVNLPARRVIFKTPYIGRDFLIKSRYSQMCGRAGRAGLDTFGESYMVLWKKGDVERGKRLMISAVEPTKSVMFTDRAIFLKSLVESVAAGACKTADGAQRWGSSLLANFIDASLPNGGNCLQQQQQPSPSFPFTAGALQATGGGGSSGSLAEELHGCPVPDTSTPELLRENLPFVLERAIEELATSGLIRVKSAANAGRNTAPSPRQQRGATVAGRGESPTEDTRAAQTTVAMPELRLDPRSQLVLTPFGQSAVRSCFEMEEAMMIKKELRDLQEAGLIMSDHLHICYFLTPVREIGDCDWTVYERLLSRMTDTRQKIANRLGVDEGFVCQRAMGLPAPPITHSSSFAFRQSLFTTRRFFVALMLSDILNEVPVEQIEQKFKTTRGNIQNLMKSASIFSSSITNFCNAMEWFTLEAIFSSFVKRLGYGVKPDLVPLMEIKGVQAPRARALWNAGFKDAASIHACGNPEEIVRKVKDGNPSDSKAAKFFTHKAAVVLVREATKYLNAQKKEKEGELAVLHASSRSRPPH